MKTTVAIENHYVGGPVVKETVTVELPPAHSLSDLDEWAEDNLFPLTGTGRTKGDAGYFVKIIDADLPGYVGLEFEWGV